MKFGELIIWVGLGLLLIWFFRSSSVLQISLGIVILCLLLWRDSSEGKAKNSKWERASHETFYDAMKWVAFGIFVVIYPPFLKTDIAALLVTIFIFVLVLFGLNVLKEKNSPRVF
jgi:cadmium resistance protein CadD (predicted permease)